MKQPTPQSYDNAYHSREQFGNEVSVLLFLISSVWPIKKNLVSFMKECDDILIQGRMIKRDGLYTTRILFLLVMYLITLIHLKLGLTEKTKHSGDKMYSDC